MNLEHSFSDDDEQESAANAQQNTADLEQRLREAEEKVTLLTQSNGRLEDMCGRFRAIIERKTSAPAESSNQTVAEEEDGEGETVDAGDAAEVVSQILNANSGKGKKDKSNGKTPVKITPVVEEQTAPSTASKKRKLPTEEKTPTVVGKTPVKASKKK
jgi:hypothetical protein